MASVTTQQDLENFSNDRIENLPRSARKIYSYLAKVGQAKPRDLIEPLNMPPRTIRHGLKRLVEEGLVKKIPDLNDLRSNYYRISN